MALPLSALSTNQQTPAFNEFQFREDVRPNAEVLKAKCCFLRADGDSYSLLLYATAAAA
jgi:hypothetical protein